MYDRFHTVRAGFGVPNGEGLFRVGKAVEALANSQMAASDAIHAKLMSYEAASRAANANAAIYSLKTRLTEEGVLSSAKEEECDDEASATEDSKAAENRAEPQPEKQE